MPIIRGEHDFEESFTRIPNRWLRDQRLSLKAIGLLAQLHSHSVGWRVTIASLAQANNTGLEAIRSAVKELEATGYLKRSQSRTEANQFAEAIWTTCDPLPDFPLSGFPSSGFPISGKSLYKKNNIKNEQVKEIYGDFDEFWEIYPRKVGKASAEKAYLKAIQETAPEIVQAGAEKLARDPNLPPVQFIPHPTTWLNRSGWNDEPYPEREKTQEERAAEALLIRQAKAERDRELSKAYLAEQEQIAAQAAPPPMCEHDKTLARCNICARKLAKND